jgi:hypothetical protein
MRIRFANAVPFADAVVEGDVAEPPADRIAKIGSETGID